MHPLILLGALALALVLTVLIGPRRLAGVIGLACLTVLVLATAASAADGTTITDVFNTAQLLALIGGVVLPFVVALLSKIHASAFVMAAIATACSGLLALGTYLANMGGAHTWKGALSVFVITVVMAAASRVTITGGADKALQARTGGFGLG
jgi:peptidoglycan/LPS O-acetylase OafA/YrhL